MESVEIVIDGMNVARSREKDCPWLIMDDTAAVSECIQFFVNCGADVVKVFGATRWCESSQGLKELQAKGLLFSAPGGLDDGFMLNYADRKGAFVVSNDRFLDHTAPNGTGFDPSWVAFHRLSYMWEPEFAADPNGMQRVAAYQAGRSLSSFAAGCAHANSGQCAGCGARGSGGNRSGDGTGGGGVGGGGKTYCLGSGGGGGFAAMASEGVGLQQGALVFPKINFGVCDGFEVGGFSEMTGLSGYCGADGRDSPGSNEWSGLAQPLGAGERGGRNAAAMFAAAAAASPCSPSLAPSLVAPTVTLNGLSWTQNAGGSLMATTPAAESVHRLMVRNMVVSGLPTPTTLTATAGTDHGFKQVVEGSGELTSAAAAAADARPESEQVTEVLHVPKGAVGRIIGKGGQNIRALEASAGCRVTVERHGTAAACGCSGDGGGGGGHGGGETSTNSDGLGYRSDGTYGAVRSVFRNGDEEQLAAVTVRGPPEAVALATATIFDKVRLFQAHGTVVSTCAANTKTINPKTPSYLESNCEMDLDAEMLSDL